MGNPKNGLAKVSSAKHRKDVCDNVPHLYEAKKTKVDGKSNIRLARKLKGPRDVRKTYASIATGTPPKPQKKLATATLILKHLPQTINYSQLKAIFPTARRLELYKKDGKRHAFARFSSTEECSAVASKLRNLKIDGCEVKVTFASHSHSNRSHPIPGSEAENLPFLHLSNLPFDITQEKLREEFPTASQITMNENSHGRFRGSCLLQFDSPDDCRIVRDACRGRQIGGRPIRCNAAVKIDVKQADSRYVPESVKNFGLKVKGVPTRIDENEVRASFDQLKLIEFRCAKDSDQGTRTVLLKFESRQDQCAALSALNRNKFFGLQLQAKIWSPRRRKRGRKKKNVSSQVMSNGVPELSSLLPSKRRLTKESEPEQPNHTSSLDDTFTKESKPKKKRFDLDESV